MAQLARFQRHVLDTLGNAISGASVTVYREGATINGNQSGTSPLTVTVRHRGKIAAADTVFIGTTTGTTYSVDSVTTTTVVISGFVGTLNVTAGDRIVPSNSQPTLYGDDSGGATTTNPLTTSATGYAQCYLEYGAYDVIVSGGGSTTTLFQHNVMPTEAPARSFYAESYGLTVAGVQMALDEAEAGGGGTVFVPSTANIQISDTSVKVPNRVRLMGFGEGGSTPTFKCTAAANVSAMIENKTQDGTQEYCWIERIQVDGNKGAGAVATSGIYLKGVFANSQVKDCTVTGVSGDGISAVGHTANSAHGPVTMSGLYVVSNGGHNILISGPANAYGLYNITSEIPGTGKSCLRIVNAGTVASFGHVISNFYSEANDATALSIDLNGCSNVSVDGAVFNGTTIASLVKISGTVVGSDGAFAAAGHVLRNLYANLTTIVDDTVSGVTVGNAQGRFVRYYHSPIAPATDLDKSQVVGLQQQRKGAALVAAAALTPGEGNYFVVSGNTGITSITAAARDNGRIIVLHFSGTPTITDGSNLIMAGNLVASADDTLTLVCDGTNWIEIARSVN